LNELVGSLAPHLSYFAGKQSKFYRGAICIPFVQMIYIA
jgi:hypothetical protein